MSRIEKALMRGQNRLTAHLDLVHPAEEETVGVLEPNEQRKPANKEDLPRGARDARRMGQCQRGTVSQCVVLVACVYGGVVEVEGWWWLASAYACHSRFPSPSAWNRKRAACRGSERPWKVIIGSEEAEPERAPAVRRSVSAELGQGARNR